MNEPRRVGRPSRIRETIREVRCPECGDWTRAALFRIHFEADHPLAPRPRDGELREIPLPDRIAEYVAAGCSLEAAAAACGVGRRTAYSWQAVGEEWDEAELLETPEDRRPFAAFARAIADARLAAETRYLRTVERAAPNDWRAAAWILERTRPEKFGRLERLRVGGDRDSEPVRIVHEERDPNFVADVMAIYRAAGIIPEDAATDGADPETDD
jgi:hypothetical protein